MCASVDYGIGCAVYNTTAHIVLRVMCRLAMWAVVLWGRWELAEAAPCF